MRENQRKSSSIHSHYPSVEMEEAMEVSKAANSCLLITSQYQGFQQK